MMKFLLVVYGLITPNAQIALFDSMEDCLKTGDAIMLNVQDLAHKPQVHYTCGRID